MHPGAFLALSFADGSPIPLEHGGPRIVLPHLFGWKSCKWLHSVQFLDEQAMGFWERLGCHMRGRVELGERWAPRSKSVWDFLVCLPPPPSSSPSSTFASTFYPFFSACFVGYLLLFPLVELIYPTLPSSFHIPTTLDQCTSILVARHVRV